MDNQTMPSDIIDASPLSDLANLTRLNLGMNPISEVGPVSGLPKVETLSLHGDNVTELGPLSDLPQLSHLVLDNNDISDLGPLVTNAGLDALEVVGATENPLDSEACGAEIPALRERGVRVDYGESCDAYPDCPP
jgi:Leucine-rich repeat (LRR) protein